MLRETKAASADISLADWLQRTVFSNYTSSSNQAKAIITGRHLLGNALAITDLEISGIQRVKASNPLEYVSIAITDFGHGNGQCGGREFQPNPMQLAFLALPSETISIEISSPKVKGLIIHVSLDYLLKECAANKINQPHLLSLQDTIPGHETLLMACARQLLCLMDRPHSLARSRLKVPLEASIVTLLASLVSDGRPAPTTTFEAARPESTHVNQAIQFFKANLSEPITLSMICQACNVSARTLQAAFQSASKQTPLQMLHEMRLRQLHELLVMRRIKVHEACRQVGLKPNGRLSASYKNFFGELPRQTQINSWS